MRVKELLELLKDVNPNAKVYVNSTNYELTKEDIECLLSPPAFK